MPHKNMSNILILVQIFLRLTSGKEKKKKYDKNDRQIDNLSHKIKKKESNIFICSCVGN